MLTHWFVEIFSGQIFLLTLSTRISAAVPGNESKPFFINSLNTSSTDSPDNCEINAISAGENPCTWISWETDLIVFKISI